MFFNPAFWPAEIDVYFYLVWLFAIVIFVLMTFLCWLYLSLRRAQEQETQSQQFSHLVIAGQEAERRRIVRDLHDTVLPELRGRAASGMIREICARLMPPDFDRLSLSDSLAGLCTGFARKTGLECIVHIEDGLDFASIGPENRLHLYRIVQEGLTNIEKHSDASRAILTVRFFGQAILLCLSDDGKGLKTGVEGRGLGMLTMRQRAAIAGAKIGFISEDGNGLMIRVEYPLPPSIQYNMPDKVSHD